MEDIHIWILLYLPIVFPIVAIFHLIFGKSDKIKFIIFVVSFLLYLPIILLAAYVAFWGIVFHDIVTILNDLIFVLSFLLIPIFPFTIGYQIVYVIKKVNKRKRK